MEIKKYDLSLAIHHIPRIVILLLFCVIDVSARDVIAIFRSYESSSDQLFQSIKKELSTQYSIYDMIITSDSKCNEFDFAIRRWNPALVILLGNSSVNLYASFQSKSPEQTLKLPSLLIATTQNKYLQSRIPNSVAINLDVPISTSLLTMQSVVRVRFKNPGIIHSNTFSKEVEFEKDLLKKNSFELSNFMINKKRPEISAQIQECISRLIDTIRIDCLILPNEPELYTSDLLPIWRSCLNQSGVPVISNCSINGLDSCVFVSCTILPDTSTVGSLVARKIKQIKANGWQAVSPGVDHIISVKKIANLKCIGQISNISSDIFKTFDAFIE
jgi:hypothetical protein